MARPPGDRTAGRLSVTLALDRCTGCQECVAACTADAVELLPDSWVIELNEVRCTGCRKCVAACPFRVIALAGPIRNRHRVVLDGVHEALRRWCPPGWRVAAAEPVLRPDADASPVAPDVTLLRVAQRGLEWLPPDGPPIALVVEVVSPSSRSRDLGARRELYWRCGAPTYWTVDQRSGQVTVQWSSGPAWFYPIARSTFG
jgi:ferredoxin